MKDAGYSTPTSLRRYITMATRCGVNCNPALLAAGITPQRLAGKDPVPITNAAMEHFLERIIPVTREPCFGLKTAQLIQPDTFDILGYIALNCASMREALALFPLYEGAAGDIGYTTVERRGELTLVRWNCGARSPLVRRHMVENVLASWTLYTNRIIGVDAKPLRVWFSHPAPGDVGLLRHYHDIFRCEVLFGQPCDGSWIDDSHLDTPFPQANRALLATLLEHAARRLEAVDRDASISHRVKNMIRLMLAESLPSRERVAAQLGMSSRTLQRHLSGQGQNYNTLLRDVRRELAIHYLEHSSLSLDEISRRLGFSETRSFHRSFKQWTGTTATAFRKDLPRQP
ncbi:AraC family transcriptional regulator [Exilibacterium tricleocarpae]|uniref:AraC family transcriptional regulator n=1 Tax=Exilibacterium tricleocarpae TaxID=2591008 RepID=A0A545U9Z8_9GAMM|nr:AraC family transcriptional regulator [Exilibacterium tricleocarpae]TQV86307.1 AraC family transcriptional regulator [Exilibacterium tricleocarpae]